MSTRWSSVRPRARASLATCAQAPSIINTVMEIQHFSHEHPLVLSPTEGEGEPCNLCSGPIDHLAFTCSECGFLLHKKCARLPRETKLFPLHPQHTLVLIPDHPDPSKPVKCGVCEKTCRGSVFRCSECDYNVEVSCFLITNSNLSLPSPEKSRKTDHFTHQHSLILRYSPEKNPVGGLSCRACGKPVSGPAYLCPECPEFSLHKSCKFPEQIQHPFHPSHPLTLYNKSPYPSGRPRCDACRKTISNGFVFHCSECGFDLDLVCASRSPSLKHDKHDKHPLEFFEQTFQELVCSVCGKPSSERIYRCVPCKFNVHSTCLQFPSTVKHRNHQHSLSLKESIAKGDSSWFPCEVCKKGITPKHRVYYCEPCSYGVHIECVDSKVTPTSDPGLVKLLRDIAKVEMEAATLIVELKSKVEALNTKLHGLLEICSSMWDMDSSSRTMKKDN